MKKSLSLILAIAMVFSMFASVAFAASDAKELTTEEKYAALEQIGIFEGDDTGANLEGLTKREQFAKILALVFGLKEDAATANATYKDLDQSKWAVGFIGAVTKAGLMEGAWEGEFRPLLEISIEELATVAVRAFKIATEEDAEVEGDTSDWATAYVAAALDAKLIAEYEDYTVSATRADLVELAYAAYLKAQAELSVAKIAGVKAISSTVVEVSLQDAVTVAKAADFTIATGSEALEVKGATLVNEKTIRVATAVQAEGVLYTIKANGTEAKFVGQETDADDLEVVMVQAKGNKSVLVTFGKPVTDSALNVANYAFDEGLGQPIAAKFNGDSQDEVLLTTNAQVISTVYALTVSNVSDVSGNKVKTNTSTNPFSFGSVPADVESPILTSAYAKNNTTVIVEFDKEIDLDSGANVANYSIPGLSVLSAKVKDEVVTLTTASQADATVYTLTVNNVKDLSGNVISSVADEKTAQFGSVPVSTEAPEVVGAYANSNIRVIVEFTTDIDSATGSVVANYEIDGLTISKAEVKDNYVHLTTSAQEDSKVYTVKVTNVKSADGVALGAIKSAQFGSVPADTEKPEISIVKSEGSKWVSVEFTEAVSEATATQSYNYYFGSKLLYGTQVLSVKDYEKLSGLTGYATDGTVWFVKTKAQSSEAYEVTVTNVADLSGNIIDNGKYTFAGQQGAPASADLKLVDAVSTDNRTIELSFNNKVDLGTVNLAVEVLRGTEQGTGIEGAPAVISNITAKNSGKTVVVAFTNTMTAGILYEVKVAADDVNGNTVLGTANTAKFAGTNSKHLVGKITSAGAINNQTIQIKFDRAIEAGAIGLTFTDTFIGTLLTESVSADGKTLLLYFNAGEQFTQTKLYEFVLNGINDPITGEPITDLKTKIAGTPTKVVAPKAVVTAINENTIDVIFDQEIDDDFLDLEISLGGTVVNDDVWYSRFEGTDNKKVRVFLGSSAGLVVGKAHEVTITSSVYNLNGVAHDNSKTMTFAPVNTKNPAPKMLTAVVNSAGNLVVTFTENIDASSGAGFSIVEQAGLTFTAATSSGSKVTLTPSVAINSGAVLTLKLDALNDIEDEAGVDTAAAGSIKFVR